MQYDGFKVKSASEETVYTIGGGFTDRGYWQYKLTWNTDGKFGSTGYEYTEEQIERYLTEGDWVVVEGEHVKIEVLTAEFNYQGLYKGTVIDNAKVTPNGVEFKHNGKNWILEKGSYLTFKDNHVTSVEMKPIKSDGGSSSYYDFKVPEHYLELIKETGVIKTEYLIDILFKNDFDFACTFKALVRAKGITEGAGKEGNTLDYELNKMDYYEDRIKEKYNWRE